MMRELFSVTNACRVAAGGSLFFFINAAAAEESPDIFEAQVPQEPFAKFELAVRAGYAAPVGALRSGLSLPQAVNGAVPIWVDVGARLRGQFYIGAYGELAPSFAGKDTKSVYGSNNNTASALKGSVGVIGRFHFIQSRTFNPLLMILTPVRSIDPWVGVGFGIAGLRRGNATAHETYLGYELNAQIGADYWPNPYVGIGPFAMFSLGKYTDGWMDAAGQSSHIPGFTPRFHEWLTVGLRGVLNL